MAATYTPRPDPDRADPPRRELRGVVERITYQNPENGFTVARLAPERRDAEAAGAADGDRLVTLVGALPDLQPGEAISLVPGVCAGCGDLLSVSGHGWCDRCLPERREAVSAEFRRAGEAALATQPSFLRGIVERTLQAILEEEMTAHLGAARYERGEERRGYRNGSKPRTLTTRVGTLELRVPQDREGTFSTELFARYQRSEQALVTTLMEMYLQGVSTRKVAAITEELCGTGVSKSQVSALVGRLDPELKAWR